MAPPPPIALMVEREVAATAAEFAHGLLQAAPGQVEAVSGDRFVLQTPGVTLEIQIRPFGERRLGALILPLQWVTYTCVRGDAAAFRQLLARLDFAMQRGGG
ncbi:MAG: hypothetical protein ACFCUG_04250 [Thiotrichales bacterium]